MVTIVMVMIMMVSDDVFVVSYISWYVDSVTVVVMMIAMVMQGECSYSAVNVTVEEDSDQHEYTW